MPTSLHQIDQWREASAEHERLEFKEAKGQIDYKLLLEYCVAIANEGGGNLVLGISDQRPRRVVGTKAINDSPGMAGKMLDALGFRVDIEVVAHPEGRVVVLHIPGRPRGTAYHHDGRYLMRSGASLVPMSEDQLRRIFAEGQKDWLDEHSIVESDAQQVVELLDTQTYFELVGFPYPSNRDGVIDRL